MQGVQKMYCNHCQYPVDSNVLFCPYCGSSIKNSKPRLFSWNLYFVFLFWGIVTLAVSCFGGLFGAYLGSIAYVSYAGIKYELATFCVTSLSILFALAFSLLFGVFFAFRKKTDQYGCRFWGIIAGLISGVVVNILLYLVGQDIWEGMHTQYPSGTFLAGFDEYDYDIAKLIFLMIIGILCLVHCVFFIGPFRLAVKEYAKD